MIKWLKLGTPYTKDELETFRGLKFHIPRMRSGFGCRGGSAYDSKDQEQYLKDCDRTYHLLDSAIEMDLVTEAPSSGKSRDGSSQFSQVKIDQADTVIMEDSNIVAVLESITISQLLNKLGKRIEATDTDPQEQGRLLKRLKESASHPLLVDVDESNS